ncbi:hypothetical protein AX16_005925 [Volvariella volvacea WC 439]|nr:hypothetical protein AX16_005925 [Volvariella volvacea WC 439]
MGSSHSTPYIPPPPKSASEVQQDLQNILHSNARNLLYSDFRINASGSWGLPDILHAIGSQRFQSRFGWAFNDDARACSPPEFDRGGSITPIAAFCSVQDAGSEQTRNYIEAVIFSKLTLPGWMSSTARGDVDNIAQYLLSINTDQQWRYNEYSRTFDSNIEDQDSWRVEAEMIYCTGALTEDGVSVHVCMLYFLGAYYNIKSPTRAARDALHQEAYSSAGGLTRSILGRTIISDEDLTSALNAYGRRTFRDTFGYDFGGTPNDRYFPAKSETYPLLTSNTHLCYFQDGDATNRDSVPRVVRDEIFSGINIPILSLKGQAMNDVIERCRNIYPYRNQWQSYNLDAIYGIDDPLVNPIRMKGFIFYWYDNRTADRTGANVTIMYIFYLGMFFEVLPVEIQLSRDLIIDLCGDLRRHIPAAEIPFTDKEDDELTLSDLLKIYSSNQFSSIFGFDWQMGHPSDQKSKIIRRFGVLCEVQNIPAEESVLQKFIDSELFTRNGSEFPPYAQAPIYDEVLQHFFLYLGSEADKLQAQYPNQWTVAHHSAYFDDPAGVKDPIHQYALCTYVHGRKVEDALGRKEIKRGFVWYSGVFVGVSKESEGLNQ